MNFELGRLNFSFATVISEKTWQPEAVLRLFFGIVTTLCFGGLMASLVTQFATTLSAEQRKLISMIVVGLFLQGGALLWIHLFLRGENISWSEAFGFNTPRIWFAIGVAVLAAAVIIPVLLGLQQLSSYVLDLFRVHAEAQPLVRELQKPGMALPQKIVFGFIAIVAAPLAEESFFRGILYPTIKQAGYPGVALWGTSFLFALSHVNLMTALPLLVFAVLLVLLYERTGNLLAPIITHSLFNTFNFIVLVTQGS